MSNCPNKQHEVYYYLYIFLLDTKDDTHPPRYKQNMASVLPFQKILLNSHLLHHNRELISIGRSNKQLQEDY